MIQMIKKWMLNIGFSKSWASPLANAVMVLLIVLACILCWLFVKTILIRVIAVYIRRSKSKWDDIFLERRLFSRAANLAPAIILHLSAPVFPGIQVWIQRLALSHIALVTLLIIFSLLDGLEEIYRTFEISREKPIKGILQVLKIIFSAVAFIIIVSILVDRSPWALLSGIGVFSAVLLLIFQNSILGFVAGIQLAVNDMVRVGDWIEMPKYNADGNVIEITLHTVKVQNWDKTITMIPSHTMVSDSFKNWRGMRESGGRRIKRTVYIDINSIKFCTDEMLQRFEKLDYTADYIKEKRKEADEHGKAPDMGPEQGVRGRRITNIGIFRAYMQKYLENLPGLNRNMTVMVRQQAPTQYGLPIEIYCFSASTQLAGYESVQAEIIDHVLAVIPQFDLRIYQSPSGKDFMSTLAAGNQPGRSLSD